MSQSYRERPGYQELFVVFNIHGRGSSPCLKAIGIYTKFPKRKLFQGKALSSSSAQMNSVSHDNIIIFSDGYNAVFSGFSSVDRIVTPAYTDFMELDSNLNSISRNKMRLV